MTVERGRTGEISWLRTGPNPRILFLHGYSDAADCWSPLLATWSGQYDALAVDARGHGESGLSEEPFGMHVMARETAQVLDALGGRPVVLAGTSMGGLTAAVLAAQRPDLVDGLVLAEPAPGTRVPTAPAMPVPDWVREVKALDRNAKLAWCRAEYPRWPEDELLPWAIAKEQLDVRLHEPPWEHPVYLPDTLERVRCPVRLVLGDPAAGSVVDVTTERACTEAASGVVKVVRLDGTGHAICREARDRFVQELTAFLDTLPSSG
jgi:pimeloyl-ACP methyl ester carboxylesterase